MVDRERSEFRGYDLRLRSEHFGAGLLSVALAGSIGFFLVFGYLSPVAPLLIAPILTGLLALCVSRDITTALAGAFASGLLGSLASVAFYPVENLKGLLESMPEYANTDVTSGFYYNTIIRLFEANPLNVGLVDPGERALFILVASLLSASIPALFLLVARRAHSHLPIIWKALPWVALVIISIGFIGTMWQVTPEVRAELSMEPPTEQYAFDPYINLKTYYLMHDGMGYYDAIVTAADGDARLEVPESGFKSGWGAGTPVRRPELFYLWQVLAPGGDATWLLWGSMALSVGLLFLSYRELHPHLGRAALYAPLLVSPALLVHSSWMNLLHPDWWATLAVLFSLVLAIGGRLSIAGGLAILAGTFREVTIPLFAIIFVIVVMLAVRRKEYRKGVVILGALFALWLASYALHYGEAVALMDPSVVPPSLLEALRANAEAKSFAEQFLAPTSYLMFPYGGYVMPTWILAGLGAVGYALLYLREKLVPLLVPLAYVTFWLLFYVVLGPTSSYWGQHVMPAAIMGAGVLLAILIRPEWGRFTARRDAEA